MSNESHAYLISLIKDNISVFNYVNRNLSIITNNGEETQTYNENIFWEWFKGKIEYDNQALSFVVITDEKDFSIPKSSQIQLNHKNSFDNYDINELISVPDSLFVLSFPEHKKAPIQKKKKQIKKVVQADELLNENDIVDFFRETTQSYKNG